METIRLKDFEKVGRVWWPSSRRPSAQHQATKCLPLKEQAEKPRERCLSANKAAPQHPCCRKKAPKRRTKAPSAWSTHKLGSTKNKRRSLASEYPARTKTRVSTSQNTITWSFKKNSSDLHRGLDSLIFHSKTLNNTTLKQTTHKYEFKEVQDTNLRCGSGRQVIFESQHKWNSYGDGE